VRRESAAFLLALTFGAGALTPAKGTLPMPQPLGKRLISTVGLDGSPDWLELAFSSVWISDYGVEAVLRLDPKTRTVVARIPIKKPCAAMGAGFGSVWVASCSGKTIERIDAATNAVVASIPLPLADDEGEASIAVGEGGVWVLSDPKGILARIDPASNLVVARIDVKPFSYAAMAGFGAVWITNTGPKGSKEAGSVQRVDAATNRVVVTIPVPSQPRFLAVGEGAVWTLNQGDGSVSKIDPATNRLAATIGVGVPGSGGDIAAGEGAVWVRATRIMLSVIDPKTNRVVESFGPPQGSGAVRAGQGIVWLSAHDVKKVYAIRADRHLPSTP
jgi:virginiamycin B lyase